jgi:hypothetical protein
MRMRQSLAQFEAAFRAETADDRERRERLRREAAERSRVRRKEKVRKHGTARFVGLVVTIIATTVLVTIAMFETLARLMG